MSNGIDVEGVTNLDGGFVEERIAEDNNHVDEEEQVDPLLTGEQTTEEVEFEVIEEVVKENEPIDKMDEADLLWESAE